MITLCWAAKGGSGTTVVASSLGLCSPGPTLLVDLAGDMPAVLGVPQPTSPGVHDWLASDAPTGRLELLEIPVRPDVSLLPAGAASTAADRWELLADHLVHQHRSVVVDAGTGAPPATLLAVADRRWLVTRGCYLALRAARRLGIQPDGVVEIDEPGRAFGADEVSAALGAPVVLHLLHDPAVARAVDAGLLLCRLPRSFRRRIEAASR